MVIKGDNKCIDCGKLISKKSTRCLSCARKGKNNPMYGKAGFGGKNHKPESNIKRSKTIKRMYASGVKMGFKSDKFSKEWLSMNGLKNLPNWKGKKLPFDVWNKGLKGEEYKKHFPNGFNYGPPLRGKDSPAWKGGITPLRVKISCLNEYKSWRTKVFERDLYTCQECGQVGGSLQVHHIKSYSIIRQENNITSVDDALICDELWDVDNGQTLCINCHKKTNNYLNNKGVTDTMLNVTAAEVTKQKVSQDE